MITAAAPAFSALTAFVRNVHEPRRIRTASPVRFCAIALQPSFGVVPVLTIGRLPDVGGSAAPVIVW